MPRTVRSATLTALGFALAIPLLIVLAYYVHPLRVADARVLWWFSSHEYTTAGSVAKFITFFAEPVPMLVIVGLGCAYAVRRGRGVDALAGLAVVGGANLTTQVLKQLLAHDRFESFLTNPPDLNTFPSGHVTGAASMIVALIWASRRDKRRLVARLGIAYVLLVGVSVLVLEWHFPSDVLGAFAVTGAWAFGVLAVYLHLLERYPRFDRRSRRRTARRPSRPVQVE